MPRFAIIENNTVINIVEASTEFAAFQGWVPAQEAGIGWLLDNQILISPIYIPPPIEEIRSKVWLKIKAIRDTKTQEGGYLAAGKWFHSDTFSRTQHLGLLMMGAGVPTGLYWKCMDGSFVEMTPILAGQIFAAAAAQDQALFAHAEALKTQTDAAADPSTIDITVGWPTTYSA